MADNEFERNLQAANIFYKDGEYSEAVQACFFALVYAKSNEEKAVVLNRRGWAARYDGFKSEEEKHREGAYEMARKDWRKVLELSSDIDLKISAIKGLMLLPGEDVKALCQMGKVTVSNYANNLTAEIMNSYGLVIRETDVDEAMSIFEKGYEKAEKGTTISGHLAQNVGTCRLIQKDREKSLKLKREYALGAMISLRVALKEYPENQIEHRRSVQGKIDNTQKEIENNFQ